MRGKYIRTKEIKEKQRKKAIENAKLFPPSEETRKKISEKNKGRKHTPEAIEKIRQSHKGKKWSEESKKRFSEKCKGRIISEETKKKISEKSSAWQNTPEAKKWRSEIGKGRTWKLSEETKKKLSASKKGKTPNRDPIAFRKIMKEVNNRPEKKERQRIYRIQYMIEHPTEFTSSSEKLFLDEIEKIYNVVIKRQVEIGGRFFDGQFGNHIIEIDGEYWHNRKPEIDLIKDKIIQQKNHSMHRFTVNNTDDVEPKLIQYKNILDEIFAPNQIL